MATQRAVTEGEKGVRQNITRGLGASCVGCAGVLAASRRIMFAMPLGRAGFLHFWAAGWGREKNLAGPARDAALRGAARHSNGSMRANTRCQAPEGGLTPHDGDGRAVRRCLTPWRESDTRYATEQ